mmetsp:Transcript_4066/g.8838  ORF Transcript_4066/g.8838 Transcript_4066/m.8838 type:complete len:218 (+) Transcript_4066:1751-2404(+)
MCSCWTMPCLLWTTTLPTTSSSTCSRTPCATRPSCSSPTRWSSCPSATRWPSWTTAVCCTLGPGMRRPVSCCPLCCPPPTCWPLRAVLSSPVTSLLARRRPRPPPPSPWTCRLPTLHPRWATRTRRRSTPLSCLSWPPLASTSLSSPLSTAWSSSWALWSSWQSRPPARSLIGGCASGPLMPGSGSRQAPLTPPTRTCPPLRPTSSPTPFPSSSSWS